MLMVIALGFTACGNEDDPKSDIRELQYTIMPFKGVEMSVGKLFPTYYGADIEHGIIWPLRINNFQSYQPGTWYRAVIESHNGALSFKSAEAIQKPQQVDYDELELTATPINDYACDATDASGNIYKNINIEGLEMLNKGSYVVKANRVTLSPEGKEPKVYFLLTGIISRP